MSRRDEWDVTRIKYIAGCNIRTLPEDTDPDLRFTYVDISNVRQGHVNVASESLRFAEAPSRARRIAEPGDTVVSTVRTYLRAVATVPETEQPLVFSTGFAVLHPLPNVDPTFLSYYLQGDEFVDRVVASSTGVSYPAITATDLIRLSVRLPGLDEQRAIAAYLDHETAKVDALVVEQQGLVEVLWERRQAVVDLMIGRVTAPEAPLRRFIEFLTSGSRGWGDYYADEGERFLRIANLPRTNLSLRGEVQHVALPDGVTEGARTRLRGGDLLFSITAYLGSVAVVDDEWVDGYVSQHVALCRLNGGLDARFVGWSMLATSGQNQLKEGAFGGTKQQLALDDIRALTVAVPPLEEQRRIAAYLDDETAKIDALIAEAEGVVAAAKERRSALITAAVTGQIDVRGRVA